MKVLRISKAHFCNGERKDAKNVGDDFLSRKMSQHISVTRGIMSASLKFILIIPFTTLAASKTDVAPRIQLMTTLIYRP